MMRLNRSCRVVLILFIVAYLFALAMLLIGMFGLFGEERDPLSGVFLIPLGLPWIWMIDTLPDSLLPWAAAVTPLVNIAILGGLCRLLR